MTTTSSPIQRFDPVSLSALDEPVRRYLTHAIAEGSEIATDVRLQMIGKIDVGRWLSFSAEQDVTGCSFSWRARAGLGPFKALHVVDSYADGVGSVDVALLGRVRFMHADDESTTRASAGRLVTERIFVPGGLLPGPDVHWRAEAEDRIVASLAAPPEHPEITMHITETGAVRDVCIQRWGNVGQKDFGYIPFGGTVSAERRFGDVVLPSVLSVGWWFGTPRFKPFFDATILDAQPAT